eukprot:SAG22_NODE_12396_length_443_cov_0.843478_1_plen_59_part_01
MMTSETLRGTKFSMLYQRQVAVSRGYNHVPPRHTLHQINVPRYWYMAGGRYAQVLLVLL